MLGSDWSRLHGSVFSMYLLWCAGRAETLVLLLLALFSTA